MRALYGLLLGVLCACGGTEDKMPYQNTIAIEPGDSQETIIEKAAHVVPTANQLAAQQREFIAFIHFGPNTFTRLEWGTGMEDPKIFDLKTLDTDQWCEAMKEAGIQLVILTAKHHDGFVLWQSRYTRHGIMSTNFQEGKGDIMRDLSASCKKYGLKLGIYLSPADLYHIENPDGLYGNLSKPTKRVIPREVEGRPFADTTKFEFVLDDYNEYFMNQLFELLTEYGPIDEVWFDGAHPKRKGGQQYDYHAWKTLIQKLAPNAIVFGREGTRWCGNEAGGTRDTEWNVIPYQANPDTMSVFHDLTDTDLGSREKLYAGKFLHYQPAETNTSIREGWFYRDDEDQKTRSADDVFDIYERAVGGNSIFLLNIPPNREGRFSQTDVDVLKEAGKRIRETYGTDLLADAKADRVLLDRDLNSFVTLPAEGGEITIRLPEAKTINRVAIQEAIAVRGERVETHALDAWIDGQWQEVAQATNIGYKRILRFPDVTTDRLRLRVIESRLAPAIATISAHYYHSRPPRLEASRGKDGLVTIQPSRQAFGWNRIAENAASNLNAGYTIYYTTDGTEPTEQSTRYETPFELPGSAEIQAVAILNGERGAVHEARIGYAKTGWTLVGADTEADKHEAALAIDANPLTYWKSNATGARHTLTIDFGERLSLNGFIYTPQTENGEGMIAKGRLSVSDDGKTWRPIETFELGNLINDPSPRAVRFKAPSEGRYVKLESMEIAGGSRVAAIGEIDFY